MTKSFQAVYLLTHALDRATELWPDHPAIRYAGDELTYRELGTRANKLAYTLLELGVQRGDRIGIYMNKCLEAVVAVYGIMKAGAAYVPLDPFAPLERLQYVIEDCNIRCIATNHTKADELARMTATSASIAHIIGLEEKALAVNTVSWQEVFGSESDHPPLIDAIEDDLSYILYTSGSTGTPKGIMHTHRSALTFAEWAATTYELQHTDILSNHAPLHFDLSTFDLFAAARVGATTVIIPEALTKFPVNLTQLIERERISVWYSVPYALIQLLQRGALDKYDLSSLRWILFAGEPFPTKHLRNLMSQLSHARYSNLYGPTETNVCTYYHVPQLPEDSDEPIPIGKPCANAQALVLDSEGNEVEPGDVGELLIRSSLLMQGYWGRPDQNEKGFYRQPVFDHYHHLYYRTGDLVQLNRNGDFKYLGRKDRQIKTRGYRVELDEIEVALLSFQGVSEAAVFTIPDGEGSNVIEAAITTRLQSNVDIDSLIQHISEKLPPYALPQNITVVDQFPRTSTGKIDRRSLQTWSSHSSGDHS